jgi:TnpA family transposase
MQIGIDQKLVSEYSKHRQHIARHQENIRKYLRLKSFTVSDELIEFIFESATRLDQITLLLSEAKQFLKLNKILFPSDDTLERLIVTHRDKARKNIFSNLMELLSDSVKEKIDQLLQVESRASKLQYLKHPPSTPSPKSMLTLARKLTIIKDTEVLKIDIAWINNNYQRSLAKYVHRCSANRLRELKTPHRYTALVCFLWQTSRDTIDYMMDMHSKIITRVYSGAENKIGFEVQRNRKNIKKSLSMLKTIGTDLLDDQINDADLRKGIFKKIKRYELKTQISESEPLLTGKFSHIFNLVISRFNYFRRFTPALIDHLQFEAESKRSTVLLKAIDSLREMNDSSKRKLPLDAPIGFIPKKLMAIIMPDGINVDRRGWECALLTSIRDEIKAGNLSIKGGKRYSQFNNFFIPDDEWKKVRIDFYKRAKLPKNPKEVPAYLNKRLNIAYDKFLTHESVNEFAKVENGSWVLSVDPAESFTLDEHIALEKLKSWLSSRMRTIKLPQLLIEVDNDLHFTEKFVLPAHKLKREADEIRVILVAIMAHGCFLGPYTMARLTQGVSYDQIRNITDWQLTEDAQRLALANVVNGISKLDISKQWGEGKTSTSDGQRFKYKRKALRQTYSTKFGDYALEFYTFVADNYAPYYSTPIECTERDAPYVLDGVLYNESDLNIEEHYTDTHGFMEINFTAFAMIGKKHSPRIKGVQRQRIYKIDKNKNYGSLTPLVKSNDRFIHMDWIVDQWDRMGQFYASLERGHMTASTALKRLAGFDDKNHFYRANREFGRVLKTENILEYMADPLLRQNRRRGLLKGEQIHQLARDVAYGKRGKISVRDLHEQKNTCSCLTLILACIIYWQAKEINSIINEHGDELDPACLAMLPHVSPIGWDNVILYGEYVVDKRLIK